MRRKALSLLLCLLLLSSFVLTGSASSSLPMVIDGAVLFSNGELADLENKAQSLRTAYEMDVVILTVDTLDGNSAQDYADNYYDENGYGYGDDYSGLLFLLAMEEREWYISTCGKAIYAFTDYGLDRLGELVVPYLSSGDYYNAFDRYLDALPSYFEEYGNGHPLDGGISSYSDQDPSSNMREDVVYYKPKRNINIFVSLMIGIAAATVVILIMRGTMNTRRRQHSAGDYLKPGSYHLRTHQDLFLYSHVSKVRRQENNGGRHGGGGNSVHRSSGGRSHGGRGGGF